MLTFLAALAAPALACPTVATGTPNELTYDVARTVLVQQDGRTTFTVSVNPSGPTQDFALVLPVPTVLGEDDIQVLDAEVFTRLEGYTGLLTMQDAGCTNPELDADSAGGSAGGGSDAAEVVIEAEYTVGDYEIVILSAGESAALFSWLDTEGYHLAEATVPVLQDYIDEGMVFMAARVSPEATTADGSALPPLQVAYDAAVMSIPIRLAARNSPGQQDMLVYAITDTSDRGGRVGISNYPEFTIQDQCIWGDPATDSFPDFYEARFSEGWNAHGQAAWTTEWAGLSGSCSPCSGVQLTQEDLTALGFDGAIEDHFLTRIHLRYTPGTATQDLMLYGSGLLDATVTSFADDNEQNRWCIDACDSEGSDEDTSVPDDADAPDDPGESIDGTREQTELPAEREKGGCSVISAGTGALGLGLALLGVARRRS